MNGTVITELGSKADPETDHIRVNGKLLQAQQRHIYLLLNKPKGYVTTVKRSRRSSHGHGSDSRRKGARISGGTARLRQRRTALLTNDGELANQLMKAASHVPKTYVVKVAGTPTDEAIAKLRAGVSIATDDGKRVRTGAAAVRIVKQAANPWYEVTLIEGRNRQIRRMFEAVGHHVEKIKRVRYGPLTWTFPPENFAC